MKKIKIIVVLILFLFVTTGCGNRTSAVYLGTKDNNITRDEALKKNNKVFKFKIDGKEKVFGISHDKDYTILNNLIEGQEYKIKIDENNNIVDINTINIEKSKTLVEGIPGKKTVKNLLKTSMEPLGNTLYVFSGGWNVQDDAAAKEARSIGVPSLWKDFFDKNDAKYDFEKYYPFEGWNWQHYYGLDCSGYIGWTVYNLMNVEDGKEGYVTSSTKIASTLANNHKLGELNEIKKDNMSDKEYYLKIVNTLKPGDIISITGHVYMVVGICDDNSVVIIHSSVFDSKSNVRGGGVTLSSLSFNNNINSEASKLVNKYMKKYYKEFYSRYPNLNKDSSVYFNYDDEYLGIFHFNNLKDKEGYIDKDAKSILKDIFNQ